MGGIFSSPKSVKPPALPQEETLIFDDPEGEKKTRSRRSGKAETIITGELEPVTRKKYLLG